MPDDDIQPAKGPSSFLIECLVFNVSNSCFDPLTRMERVRAVLHELHSNTMSDKKCSEWLEVSELKYLFKDPGLWTRQTAHQFLSESQKHIGCK